jgi:hypothetical protein
MENLTRFEHESERKSIRGRPRSRWNNRLGKMSHRRKEIEELLEDEADGQVWL